MSKFYIFDSEINKAAKEDERNIKEYFESYGYNVLKLDTKNVTTNPDFRISKGSFKAVIEIKSRFGNQLYGKIVDEINRRLQKLNFSYDYIVHHKYPKNNECDEIVQVVQTKLDKLKENKTKTEFPLPLYLGNEKNLKDIFVTDEAYIRSLGISKAEWLDLNIEDIYNNDIEQKLLITLMSNNNLGYLRCQGVRPEINLPNINYFRDTIEKAKNQFNANNSKIPKGIIFVSHGQLPRAFTVAVMPFGTSNNINILDENDRILIVALNEEGLLTERQNCWLSFYGFFSKNSTPSLEIYRNCHANSKLDLNKFDIEDCHLYSIFKINKNSLIIYRDKP